MAKLLSKDGIVRLFGSAVVDQAVLSAANFAVGLLLIRYSGDVAYGRFVLVQAAVLLLIAVQRAWVIDPLTVLAPKKTDAVQREMVGAIKVSQRRFLSRSCLLALLAPPVGYFAGILVPDVALLMTVGLLACWAALERDYLRGVLMLYYRPETVLAADVVYVAVLVAGVLFAVWLPAFQAIVATLGLAVAAAAGGVPAYRSLSRSPGWLTTDATPFWREMRTLSVWATVGATIYWVLGQGYNYILVLKLDTTAVAHVNAIRLLLMPTYLLTIGIKALLLPMSVRWVTDNGFRFLLKRLAQFIVALAALDCIYFALLWFSSDWVLANVLDKQIPNHRFMIAMWFLLSLINLVRDVFLTALLVRQRFKSTARLVALSALVTVVSMWFALDFMAAPGALVGLAVGELVLLLGVMWMIWRQAKIQLPGEGDAARLELAGEHDS